MTEKLILERIISVFTRVSMCERYSDVVNTGWAVKGISESLNSEDRRLDK